MTNLTGHAAVLMVDDDADVLETTAHMLAVRGFRVFTALDSESAMQVCREQEGRIDVLIADLSLPGDSRGDLARSITSVYPAMHVIYISGIPRHVALTQGLVDPQAPYLEKPAQPAVLASIVQSLLTEQVSAPANKSGWWDE
ncbi:response regulator [Actinoplanes sp. NPDC049548]|uniref:response regulator n=1 Tax=Actinoplanes sp. NPDC049548 TaxID=3155152 RepID=UPI003424CA02